MPRGYRLPARRRGAFAEAIRETLRDMAFVAPARHLPGAKDLVDARYFEPLTAGDLAYAGA